MLLARGKQLIHHQTESIFGCHMLTPSAHPAEVNPSASLCGSSLVQQALDAVSSALSGSIHHTAELYEQYAQLSSNGAKLTYTEQLESLSHTHLQQLQLAARILHYSLRPPHIRPQPTQLDAFLWEWAIATQTQLKPNLPPLEPQPSHTVWLDSQLLQPLIEAYIHETFRLHPVAIRYEIAQQTSDSVDVLFYPATDHTLPQELQWQPASQQLLHRTPEAAALISEHYGLCLSYAALIEAVQPIFFAPITRQLFALKISLKALE